MSNSIHIPQIDGKDLWLTNYAANNEDCTGYTLLNKHGDLNLRRFKAVFDYSLDLIALRDAYKKVYRNNRFSYIEEKPNRVDEYCQHVINVTFKYSVKTFNRSGNDLYIKLGTDPSQISWNDCLGYCNGELVGVQVQHTVNIPRDLPSGFTYNNDKQCYIAKQSIKTVQSVDMIRQRLYNDGFWCNGIHYVRWKRSAGSARVGKCLFINESLYRRMHRYEMCGLSIKYGDKVDLAGLQSYIALTTSSIIDTLHIKPENILLVQDYESVFHDDVINVFDEHGKIFARPENIEIHNSIWDGESLIDPQLMGIYADKGMILLRNRFYKSCAFNCNIQKWFADNNITDVKQLNGYTRATKIEDVLYITTPSSVKYLKFGTYDQWLDNIDYDFGVVKFDKPTHYLDGRLVQSHYQLINSINMTQDEVNDLLKPTFDFMTLCREKPSVLRHWIQYRPEQLGNDPLLSKNDIIYKMMSINDKFYETKLYYGFRQEFFKSFVKNLKKGHIYLEGNYSVLCGNPVELLQQAIGGFTGESVMERNCVFSKRFNWETKLIGSRSPHITASNVLLTYNKYNKLIDDYMNATEQIVYVNAIKENIMQRLAGADYDSDTILLSNNSILINAAERTTNMFKVAYYNVSSTKQTRYYTNADMTDLDIKTSNNLIGDIVNVSQELNSRIWDTLYHGGAYADIEDIYLDICKLSILSNVEIDKAKKEFVIDSKQELEDIRIKYKIRNNDGRVVKPHFFAHIARQKGFYDPVRKSYEHCHTPMDYLQHSVNCYRLSRDISQRKEALPFAAVVQGNHMRAEYVDHQQIAEIYRRVDDVKNNIANTYISVEDAEERKAIICNLYTDFADYLAHLKMNKSTMIALLASIEEQPTRKMNLFYLLFKHPCSDFYQLIKSSRCVLAKLIDDPNGSIDIFGHKFSEMQVKTYKN